MDQPLIDASTRIDPAHVADAVETETKSRRGRKVARRAQTAPDYREVGIDLEDLGRRSAAMFIVEPPESIPEIVVHHADDLSVHLATRLAEVEQREVALAEHEFQVQQAEAAARAWVAQQDMELTARERNLQLQADEIATQQAAVAAGEIAAEQEFLAQRMALHKRDLELQRIAADLEQREERLAAESDAVHQAGEHLRAERRREDELARSRRQQWQNVLAADQTQLERAHANLQRHRHALDERERSLNAREQALSAQAAVASHQGSDLETSVLRAEAARDHRTALEHRWIAGQLWAKLAGSRLASDDELVDSLELIRRQLELLYRREREALEDIRLALGETARQVMPARPTSNRAVQSRIACPA